MPVLEERILPGSGHWAITDPNADVAEVLALPLATVFEGSKNADLRPESYNRFGATVGDLANLTKAEAKFYFAGYGWRELMDRLKPRSIQLSQAGQTADDHEPDTRVRIAM